jgi:hypothetical protein
MPVQYFVIYFEDIVSFEMNFFENWQYTCLVSLGRLINFISFNKKNYEFFNAFIAIFKSF